MKATENRKHGGRPPKFDEARRPITVTLPERTLKQLARIGADRAKAIVKLADMAVGETGGSIKRLEVVRIGPGEAIILVGPSRSLGRIRGLRLVEIAPARFLLAIPSGTAVESLEVSILDLIESLPKDEVAERELLIELSRLITRQRRSDTVSKAELLFIRA